MSASCRPISECRRHGFVQYLRALHPAAVQPAAARPDQRRLLRQAGPGARRDLRHAERDQLHARRAVHDGRLRCLVDADLAAHSLLGRAGAGADHRRPVRHRDRAIDAEAHLPSRPSLRLPADLRPGADHRGTVPVELGLVRRAVPEPDPGRLQSRLHVPAGLSRLRRGGGARDLPHHLVRHRAHQARRLPARRDREPHPGPLLRHQRAAADHPDLRPWRRPGGTGGRAGGADPAGLGADGHQPRAGRVRRGGDRRHGLDHGLDRHRLRPRPDRGRHQGLLSARLQHGDLRRHGAGAAGQAGRPVRADQMNRILVAIVLAVAALVAPWFFYPVFLMKALCFALFACAFNLLLGYAGLMSFGHAMFFGMAAYFFGHMVKVWDWPIEFGLVGAVLGAALLGLVTGALAIRRQGIYFAMITLAFAQMIYFLCVQMPFTGGEDGLQGIPRKPLFFGQLLKAIRDNEQRALSLGYEADRYKLLAFVLSAAVAGLAGATKAMVVHFATLTDVAASTSGEVVLMALIGGLGTITGPVVGGFVLVAMQDYLAFVGQLVLVIQGAIFVVIVLGARRGLVGEFSAWWKARRRPG